MRQDYRNKWFQFPEEMNRQITDSISDVYFTSTYASKLDLLKENTDYKATFVTINTAFCCTKVFHFNGFLRNSKINWYRSKCLSGD